MRQAINRLFDHVIDTRGLNSVNLGVDTYWDIDQEQLYDLNEKPTDFDVGSLTDDWEFARKLLDQDWQPLANQFCEIAPLVRRIGEVLGETLAKRGG
jgi:hypothetical protein